MGNFDMSVSDEMDLIEVMKQFFEAHPWLKHSFTVSPPCSSDNKITAIKIDEYRSEEEIAHEAQEDFRRENQLVEDLSDDYCGCLYICHECPLKRTE